MLYKLKLLLNRRSHKRVRSGRLCPVRRSHSFRPVAALAVCTLLVMFLLVSLLEFRLRPVVKQLAIHQVNNLVTRHIDQVVLGMEEDYRTLVDIQRDEQGQITGVTSNMSRVNDLKARVTDQVLKTVSMLDVHDLGVPIGSLFDLDLLWAKGPKIRVHSLVVGVVSTQVHSDFFAAGINQTIHRIYFDVSVPLTILLPGISLSTTVNSRICVVETVIVGRVPDLYLDPKYTLSE